MTTHMTAPQPTALIADDEPLLRDALERMLADAWPDLHIVAQARNGREAVDQFEALQPAVCFLDVHMPGMTGVEAARQIGRRAHLVFVTAYDQYAVQAFAQGVLDYLVKPVEPARLAATVAAERLSYSRLLEAIESVSAGFSLYDADDRLVLCNGRYRELLYPGLEAVVPTAPLEQILRSAIEQGLIPAAREGRDDWVAERIAEHQNPPGPLVQQLGTGPWIRVDKRKTKDGDTVAVYTDGIRRATPVPTTTPTTIRTARNGATSRTLTHAATALCRVGSSRPLAYCSRHRSPMMIMTSTMGMSSVS